MTTDAGLSVRAYARHRGVSHTAVQRAIARGRLSRSLGKNAAGEWRIVDVALADREFDANGDLTRAPSVIKEREAARIAGGTPPVPPVPPVPSDDESVEEPPPDGDPGSVPAGKMTLAEAAAQEKAWRARLAELQYREKTGELVDARAVEMKTVEVFTRCRTKLLGVPSKLKTRLPHLSPADLRAIDAEMRAALEELATPDRAEGAA